MKLGDTVLFRSEVDHGGSITKIDYPGIVYKIYKDEPAEPLGITVLFEGIPTRYGKVMYSEKAQANCWRFHEDN